MPDERWRPVPGHKGYEASSLGRVRSVPRTLRDGRRAGGVVLAQQPDKDGYPTVKIRGKRLRVARVVQLAFAGPAEVRHKDGDRSNSKAENLLWGSRVENEQDKRRGKEKDRWEEWERPFPPGTFLGHEPISLSEAVTLGVVPCSLAMLRKSSQRDPLFPHVKGMRGVAGLYDAGELIRWDRIRRRPWLRRTTP